MANSIDYVITVNDTQAKSTINSLISDIKKLDTIPGLNEAINHHKNQQHLDWKY